MKKIKCLLLIFLFAAIFCSLNAYADNILNDYPNIFKGISKCDPGGLVDLDELGIKIEFTEDHKTNAPGNYYLLYPRDLDIKRTDAWPYINDYPALHLNLPLKLENSPTSFLVMSDQPESIQEENRYLGSDSCGTDGVYGKTTAPAGRRIRYLADHYNPSQKTKWIKIFMTSQKDTILYIHKSGASIAQNSVISGSIAEQISRKVNISDIRTIPANTPTLLAEYGPVKPEDTLVAWYEMTFKEDTIIRTIITDKDKLVSPSEADLDALPKLKSLKWKDREEKLKTIVNSSQFPSRYNRVMESFIHARGLFPYPDRFCTSEYDYKKNPQWIQAYSAFEYIEGVDELTLDGKPVKTNNRGNYGSYVRMNVKIKSLPKNTKQMAVLAVCNADKLGGMLSVNINGKKGYNFVYNKTDSTSNLVTLKKGALLWKGPVVKGDNLNIQFFSLANTSVRVWYLLIPMP